MVPCLPVREPYRESRCPFMKPPCDEAVIRSMSAAAPCRPEVKRWVLAAAVLGSRMTFLDSTVVNVALPALQTSLGATVVGVQWVVESYGLFQGALILVVVPWASGLIFQRDLSVFSTFRAEGAFYSRRVQPHCRISRLQYPRGRFQCSARRFQRRAATLSLLPHWRLERQGRP